MTTAETAERFDVAITFAGENRVIAEKIREGLVAQNLRVFYDEDFKVEMWGKNLVDFLHRVYSREATYALMLISAPYVTKHWTNHERQAAQERALTETREYLLPVKLEDVEVPGLPSTIFYLDARVEGVPGIVAAVAAKVGGAQTAPTAPTTYEGDVPATPEEFSTLLAVRPPGWEYLLFAGRLREELASHKAAYFDFEMRYTATPGPHLTGMDALDFIGRAQQRYIHTSEQLEAVLAPEVADTAFGLPGEPGDPGRISHVASRIGAIYLAMMNTAADLRAASFASDHLTNAARLVSDYAIQPVAAIRDLSETLCQRLSNLPTRLAAGEDVKIELTLTFFLPDELSSAVAVELAAARSELNLR